jgi:hypothetical protein
LHQVQYIVVKGDAPLDIGNVNSDVIELRDLHGSSVIQTRRVDNRGWIAKG